MAQRALSSLHASGQLELLDFGIVQLEADPEIKMAQEAVVATALESHPPYATKLWFVRRIDVPFPLIFQGASDLPDGRKVFQLNTPTDGKTHFRALEGEAEGIVDKRFIPRSDKKVEALLVLRGSVEIKLSRGKKVPDPESWEELINILDRSANLVSMGALFSLGSDEYTALGVYRDRLTIRHQKTGEVVGFADGE